MATASVRLAAPSLAKSALMWSSTLSRRTRNRSPESPPSNRVSWDFGRDYPNVKENDVVFSVATFPLSEDDKPTYMVIDVSAGKDAANWPVRYTSEPPQHTPGCLTDKCKLSEIWLRRVHVKDVPFCYRMFTNNMGANR